MNQFTTKVSLIIAIAVHTLSSNAQNWRVGGNNTVQLAGNPPDIGTTQNNPLNIKTVQAQPLNFFTSNQQRAIITPTGFVGIGSNSLAPLFQLNTDNDINITTTYSLNLNNQLGFRINGKKILNNYGDTNVFVGVNAGLNTTLAGNRNTFVGHNAGEANTTGVENTFIGANAGQDFVTGFWNTFVGSEAGRHFQTGRHNTFVGEESGDKQISGLNNSYFGAHSGGLNPPPPNIFGTGSDNTFLGAFAGADITNGNGNTFTGVQAGQSCEQGSNNVMNGRFSGLNTTTGNLNTFVGQLSGQFNTTGSQNVFLGAASGPSSLTLSNLNNAITIGFSSRVRSNNKMILGNNLINVGIGLSDDIIQQGPQNKLEIDAGLNNMNPSTAGTIGASGLRFRDLHSGNLPTPNGINGIDYTKVLSVDQNGDVVLISTNPGIVLGNICEDTIKNPLTNDWEIPLNNKNFIFSNDSGEVGRVGIGNIASACTPGNTLEVSKNASTPSSSGTSGLRLTDLRSGAGAASYSGKVLSVNGNGDVILMNGPTIGGGGTGITQARNGLSINPNNSNIVELGGFTAAQIDASKLISTREIPLNTYNILFSGLSTGNNQDRIIIGSTSNGGAPNSGKLQVYHIGTSGYRSAINGVVDASGASGQACGVSGYSFDGLKDSYGVRGDARNAVGLNAGVMGNASGDSVSIGILGQAISDSSNENRGGSFSAKYGITNNYGVYSQAIVSSTATTTNYGVKVNAQYGGVVYGIKSDASGFPATTTTVYGIRASASGGSVANYAGYFSGNVEVVSGNLYTPGGSVLPSSDINLKTNINEISNASELIRNLQPKSFFYDSTRYFMTHSTQKQYGLIAQDVESILPELVSTFVVPDKTDSLGSVVANGGTYKSLNYNAFIAILIKSQQEQQNTIDSMRTMMNQLASMLNSCCQSQSSRTQNPSTMDVELSDKNVIVLNQNVPNPFAEQTTITYNIPDNTGFAQIIFNDMKGQIIKVVDIKTKGQGQLNVFANDLSSGMYSYTLYVDGKAIDTKKMVKTE